MQVKPLTQHANAHPCCFWGEMFMFVFALAVLAAYYYYRFHIYHLTWPEMITQYNDQWHYDNMARSLLAGQGFSHPGFGLRPPLHPLFIASIYALVGAIPSIVALFQLFTGALVVSLTYKLAALLFPGRQIAWVAGLLLAVDVPHFVISATIMSEPLHDLLLLMSLYWLLRFLRSARWPHALAAASCVTLTLLERPTSAYFPYVIALIILIARPRLWRQALAVAVIGALAVVGWSFRGLYYRDNFSFSTSGTFTLLFYRTVAIESHALGISPNQAAVDIKLELEQRLGHTQYTRADFEQDPVGRVEDMFNADAQREAVSRQMFVEAVEKYPLWMVKLTGAHLLTQFTTEGPNAGILPRWLQLAITGLELILAGIGAVWAFRERRMLPLLMGGAVFAYYAGITALTVSFSVARYRTPYWPFVLIFSAFGLLETARRLISARQRAAGVPAGRRSR